MPYMSLREQRHLLRRYLKQYRLERTPAHRQAVQDTLLHLDPMHPAAPIMRLRYIDCRSWRATELRTYYCHSRAFELETRAIDDLLQVPAFPRTCGGDPFDPTPEQMQRAFSPHMRG